MNIALASIRARSLSIPFKAAFSHASAQRSITQTLWVEASDADGWTGYGEGCPREYVTAETVDGALAFVARHQAAWIADIHDLPSLEAWVVTHRREIDTEPAAWSAVELALLDMLGKRAGCAVETLLGLPVIDGIFRYTAVIGDGAPARFEAELDRYRQAGFGDFKIKLSGDAARDAGKIAALRRADVDPVGVRADANNLWPDAAQAIAALRVLGYPFGAVEEPIGATTGCGVILDESLLRIDQLDAFARRPARWLVNVRISKMGGLLRSLDLVARIRTLGFGVVVGAHVGETSLLTRAALTVANAAPDVVVAREGAFGTHLLAHDVIDPPIMFGAGGVLKASALPHRSGGFGLGSIDPALLAPP